MRGGANLMIKKKEKEWLFWLFLKNSHVYRVVAMVIVTTIGQTGDMCIANGSSFGYSLFAKGLHLVIVLFTKEVHSLHKGTKRF